MVDIDKSLFPFDSRFINNSGFNYHYLDEGSGEPILMVHGNPTWSFFFRNLVQALKTDYRTIVPDHIGCGMSEKPSEEDYEYTLERRVKDLENLVDHLKLDKLTLVLHDWGGMIGMAFAARNPEKIQRIVLMNTCGFHKPETKPFPWRLRICRDTRVGAFMVRGFNAFSLSATRMCVTRRKMPKKIREAYLSPYNNWENRLAVLKFVQDIPLSKEDESFDIVTQTEEKLDLFKDLPILILWGDKDFVFDHHFLQKWQNIYPHAEVHRFEDVGHYILEDAWEEVVPLMKQFLLRYPIF